MANNYATVPAIIPGDLTIQGNLTVGGPMFTFGRFPRKYRIYEINNGDFATSVNYDTAHTAKDDNSVQSIHFQMLIDQPFLALGWTNSGAGQSPNYRIYDAGGPFLIQADEVRFGTAAPFSRLWGNPGAASVYSVNLQTDNATRDDATQAGYSKTFNSQNLQLTDSYADKAGKQYAFAPRRVFWSDHTTHTLTGAAGLRTIATRTVYANQLGISGLLILTVIGNVTVSAGATVTLSISFGASSYTLVTFPASTSAGFVARFVIQNNGSLNSNTTSGCVIYGAAVVQNGGQLFSVDTSVDQALTIQSNATDSGSTVSVYGIEAEFLARSSGL
jgi:hypothetical protein